MFPSGGYQVSAAGKDVIAKFAKKLVPGMTGDERLLVTGYTDNAKIGPALARQGITSNQVLSQKRADSVMNFIARVGQEAEHVRFARAEPQQQIVADPAWRWAAWPCLRQGRLRPVIGQPVRDDGIVAALDQRDHLRPERQVLRGCEVHRMASPAQQPLHPSRPIFLFDLDQRLQFAQMVRVA